MKKIICSAIIGIFSLNASYIFAETIVLKSGRTMEGKIMQKTDKEIKVDAGTILTSYRLDEVESINGKRADLYTPSAAIAQKKKEEVDVVRDALTKGSEYLDRQMYDKAIAEFSRAIEAKPGLSDLYYNRGFAYSKAGRLNQAIADYDQAIKLNPNDSDSYYNRGVAYHGKKDYTQAISDYTESIRITPDIGAAYYNRALDYSLQQDFDKAWADVHKAESLGYEVNAYFLNELKKASKRQQ